MIAADEPVICDEYAKEHSLLQLDCWKRLKNITNNQYQLPRTINKSKIRQVMRSADYQFGFLIPKYYKQALQLDDQDAIASGMMPLSLRWTKSMKIRSFKTMEKLRLIPNRGRYQMPQIDNRKSEFT